MCSCKEIIKRASNGSPSILPEKILLYVNREKKMTTKTKNMDFDLAEIKRNPNYPLQCFRDLRLMDHLTYILRLLL
jgi:hypothetical protein